MMGADANFEFQGRLKFPAVKILSPASDFTLDLALGNTVPISVEVSFPDSISRPVKKIEYYASGTLIGTADTPPYALTWDATDMAGGNYTLLARIYDSVLTEAESAVSENQVTVKIIPPPPPPPPPQTIVERVTNWTTTNWLSLLLTPAVIVLAILLVSTRRQLTRGVRTVATATTGVLKGVTQTLGPSRAPAKLVVIRGSHPGREYKLEAQVIRVGRDAQFCDFALDDQFTSNPHFTITRGQTLDFYIQDEGSRNGTYLNNYPLQPRQQIPLAFDSVIRAGESEMTFKQIGGKTRALPRPTQKVPPFP
jgi:hypothetical protein